MELTNLTIKQIHQGLVDKNFSALEITQAFLKKIKKLNPQIFAYLTITSKLAENQAKKIDQMIAEKKEISYLAGVPVAIKDNILVESIKCTAGSKVLENYIAPYSATVINKLEKEGAIILGKTNMDEFAMGSSTESSAFGLTKNPLDLNRVPGGSSGGSAASVAANMAVYALGSDTGGSIRLPASFCGLVGLKPTYGAVSRYGLIALGSSLDQIGPITKTVEDAEIVFEAIKGRDEMDSTSVNSKFQIPNSKQISNDKFPASTRLPRLRVGVSRRGEAGKIQNLVIGIPKEYFVQGLDAKIEKIIKAAIKKYEDMGAKIKEISLPHTKYALAVYYIINSSEASSNLGRYNTKRENFGQEVKRRIMLGTYILSAGYYEAYYLKAQKVRNLIKEDFKKAFQQVDVIMTPVAPFLPFKIGEKINDPLSMYLVDLYTVSVNLAGLPALSLPVVDETSASSSRTQAERSVARCEGENKILSAFANARVGEINKLSVGLQIIGKPFEEDKIFKIGKIYEHR